jgi:zinc/manganese transport system permease protein
MLYLSILGPAFCAGCLLLISHLILGREVLARGLIFIDLAIAQFAASGLILANVIGISPHSIGMQAMAFSGAIVGSLVISMACQYSVKQQEAIIGILFVMAATGGLLLLAYNVHAGEAITQLLAGQLLWTQWSQLWAPALVSVMSIIVLLCKPTLLQTRLFYLLFAIVTTVSVQYIGVYLVFANLIVPALLTQHMPAYKALVLGIVLGGVAYAAGLFISLCHDIPGGPLIVWCMIAIALLLQVYFLLAKIKTRR